MTEKQTPHSEQSNDRDFSKAARIAAGVVAGAVVVGGIGSFVERGIRDSQRQEAIEAEWEHSEAILDEIDTKANELFIPQEESADSMVGYIPVIGDRTIYDSVLSFIPEEAEKNQFIQYTILESAKAQGTYQPDDSFGLFTDTVDGKEALIIRQIDNSTPNVYVAPPEGLDPGFIKPTTPPTVTELPSPDTH